MQIQLYQDFLNHIEVSDDLRYRKQHQDIEVLECRIYLQLYYILNHRILCIMRFQQHGTVYTQIRIEVRNQHYSNDWATAISRHTPLLWTEITYCIRVDMNFKYLDHCLSTALAEQKQFFHIQGKFRIYKNN